MEELFSWVKGIVILFAFLTVISYLIASTKYRKYVQLFLELIILLSMIKPIAGMLGKDEDMLNRIFSSELYQEWERVANHEEELQKQEQVYREWQQEMVQKIELEMDATE